jgi:hypothetical protein
MAGRANPLPGLVMRRASELCPREAKTDRRDSFVPADPARIHAGRLHWLEQDDEALERLRVLSGYDEDLAHDVTRTSRFVFAIAHLSNEAIRVASASTKLSSSASGSARFT